MYRIGGKALTTTQIIAAGFFAAIAIGTILLSLPISSRSGEWTPVIDSAFMATTSICVTGLVTLNTVEHWSFFGQSVILFLIQFGGLGVVTFTTTVMLVMHRRITLKERLLIQDAYNLDTLRGLVRLTKRILRTTLLLEGAGALFYSFQFIPQFGFLKGIWVSVFTAVSAMCNAGIDLIGAESLKPYQGNLLVNLVTMTLIIMGGLGFPVWWDIIHALRTRKKGKPGPRRFFSKLTIHSKLVITATVILILGGTIVILGLEFTNPETIGHMPIWEKVMASMFQSVTTRTAGFLTIPQEQLRDTTTFICIILMFIGGSPSGTAGGVKTVTIAMMMISVYCIIKGREDTEAFHRKIPSTLVKKGMAVVMISLSILIVATIALSITERAPFLDVLYETTSALATVGLTRNLTGNLTFAGKVIIIITMYIGRIGPITMALFFNRSNNEKKGSRTLPEGKILVG